MYYSHYKFFTTLTPDKKYRRARWEIVRYVTAFSDGDKLVYVFKEWSKKRQCYSYITIPKSYLEIEVNAGLWTTYYHKRKE